MTSRPAWGFGLATTTFDGTTLDTWYPAPALGEPDDEVAAPAELHEHDDDARGVRVRVVRTVIDLDAPPADTADAYLRLHLLSHRLVAPHGLNLEGLFAVLPNVMHEGFVNFNAGTLGTSMVEGRISAGVVVGDGSDVGGGASIMGTLSGGGREVVSVGRRTLLGANAGLGIALGDDCVVEAGLYVTAGTKVTLVGFGEGSGRVVKARELSGADGVLFRRNSLTGGVEAVARTGTGVELNAALHAN